jgi:hypothetical protein
VKLLPDNGELAKPPLIDFEEDLRLIHTQYDKEYRSFFKDFEEISYNQFYERVFSLGGNLGEVIRLRDAVVNGKKLEEQERKVAYEVTTKAIDEYLDKKLEDSAVKHSEGVLAYVDQFFSGGGS